jgi:apolipoprotein N-acyltransferase
MISPVLVQYLITYGPAVISGSILVLCFPKPDLFLMSWVALVPFLLSLYNKSLKQAFRAGFFFGIPYFFGTLYWIYHSINNYGGFSFPASISIVILLCLYLSLYPGIFAVLFSLAIRKTQLPALLIAPVFWVVLEFLRTYVFTGFPWSSIGYSQYQFLSLIQIADITGIYGVSFLVVAVNGALSDLFLLKQRTKDMPLFPLSYTVVGFVVLIALIGATVTYGQMKLREQREGKQIRASIIQGNIEQDRKWEPAYQDAVIATYKELSLKAAEDSPSIIIWPETAVPFFFMADRAYSEDLIEFQHRVNSSLLFGTILVKGKQGNRSLFSNSAVLLDESGKVTYTYDKIHLVPFGEYVPLQKILFFIKKLVVGIGDYAHGTKYIRAETSSGAFAPLICYEIIFPGLVRKFYANGGDYIVNITNDAWFGKTNGPYQHFSMAVFRAIENRKPVIRAANTGISGFIDSSGRILSQTSLFQKAVLTEDLKTDSALSFYSRYGDLFSYLCIVFSILLLANVISRVRTL